MGAKPTPKNHLTRRLSVGIYDEAQVCAGRRGVRVDPRYGGDTEGSAFRMCQDQPMNIIAKVPKTQQGAQLGRCQRRERVLGPSSSIFRPFENIPSIGAFAILGIGKLDGQGLAEDGQVVVFHTMTVTRSLYRQQWARTKKPARSGRG